MFNGINQAASFGLILTQNCKKSLKSTYNVTYTLCRTKTTIFSKDPNQLIADFYAGKSVFITGGTGFLGKAYVEKLLRGCEDIDKIYLLIRQKHGEPIQKRLNQMLQNPIFNRIKNSKPQVFNKLVPIAGDICEPKLGIKPDDEQTLRNEVSVVIHSAATVRFTEPLQVAMNINFESTRWVVDLCKGMTNLENFVYVSTAFVQTMHKVLEEKIYPAPASVEEVYNFLKKYPNDDAATAKFMGKQPSTYTFTKSLAESYVGTNPEFPTTIVRPSAVTAAYREPVPGWLDNWYSATSVCFDSARGLNHYLLGKTSNILDAIPVDYVANLTIAAGAKHNGQSDMVPVYNSTSSGCNPTTWNEFHQAFIKENIKFGFYKNHPHVRFIQSKLLMELLTFLRMKIPAHAADLMLQLQGREPRYVKLLKRVLISRLSLEVFHNSSFIMKNDNVRALYAALSDADKSNFHFDPIEIDWDEYTRIYFKGVTEFLLPRLLKKEKSNFAPVGKALA